MIKAKHKQMYMRIAEAVAETSSSKRLKVGAVAVKNNKVIGTGYNALPVGIDGDMENKVYFTNGDWLMPDPEHWPYSDEKGVYKLITKAECRHAEKNLLLNLTKSTESSEGAILFCTHSPCYFCALDIADAGITHVYYKHKYRCDEGLKYLERCNIVVEQID
jgi:dCMP deaminase